MTLLSNATLDDGAVVPSLPVLTRLKLSRAHEAVSHWARLELQING